MFTATAVLQLIADGALNLDDTLGVVLPDSTAGPALKGVRVRQLLSHTSGLIGSRTALGTRPGTYVYSNLGFALLGELVEHITQRPLDVYLAERVFGPAGMRNTGRFVLSEPVDHLAMGYVPSFDSAGLQLAPNELLHTIPGMGAGGYFASAADLVRFAQALATGRLLAPELVAQMKVVQNDATGSRQYGWGVMLGRGSSVWGHAGDLPGTDADLEISDDNSLISVVLSNRSGVNNPVRRRIQRLWNLGGRRAE